jgi:lambda repressor-like predicted transcriptional regulator
MNHTRNVDANQGKIVAALRKAGCTVKDASAVGGGFPDWRS